MMRVKNSSVSNVMYDSTQLIKKYENQIKELKAVELLIKIIGNNVECSFYWKIF